MKCNEFFTWFSVWITWFIVFSLIIRWEREVGVEDVSGPNGDLFLITRLVQDRQEYKEMRTGCTYARAKEENKSNVRMESCDLCRQDSSVTTQLSH